MRASLHEIIPCVKTPIYGYNGRLHQAPMRFRIGEPAVIRMWNDLSIETCEHLHGGNNLGHFDGCPTFRVLPGRARVYFYPNTVYPNTLPMRDGSPDVSESPSTLWYHDLAMDITAGTVGKGLCVFAICPDELEDDLISRNILPAPDYDVTICLQDRRLNLDRTLFHDHPDFDGTP